jgi:hypothetical protein
MTTVELCAGFEVGRSAVHAKARAIERAMGTLPFDPEWMRSLFHVDHRRVANPLPPCLEEQTTIALLIFSDRESKKYIQFSCTNGNIILNLPTNRLDQFEIGRAGGLTL